MNSSKHKGKTILPPQYVGNHTGAEAQVEAATLDEAVKIFSDAKERLLDINNWHTYSGTSLSKFFLTDATGNKIDRKPEIGDHIKIDLPGPGTKTGDGYDWVCIEQFDEKHDTEADLDFFGFRVRPASNPTNQDDKPAHFYTDETTSTFIIQRVGLRITACEKGRNEIVNDGTDSVIDNTRNKIVGVLAANGMAIPQWKILMEGILNMFGR